MDIKTKGQAEAEFSRSIIQFEKEYLGRGHWMPILSLTGERIIVLTVNEDLEILFPSTS